MDVSTASLVQAVAAARVALSEAFVLKVGQSLQAVVMGKGSDGLTELKIGDQVVTAKLAQTLPPGTTLQLQVKANGATPQLTIVSQTPLGGGVVARASVPVPPPVAPLTTSAPAPVAQAKAESVQQPALVVLRNESAAPAVSPPQQGLPSPPPATISVAVSQTAGRPQPQSVSTVTIPPTAAPEMVSTAAIAAPAQPAAPLPQAALPTASTASVVPQAPTVASPALVPQQASQPTVVAAASLPEVAVPTATLSVPLPATPVATPSLPTTAAAPPSPAAHVAASAQAVAPEAEPSTTSLLLVAQATPRPQATVADLPRVAAPPVAPLTQLPTPPQPATPQAALTQMVPEALAKQDTARPLLASLAAVVERPNLLPAPILRAALSVLAQRIIVTGGQVPAAALEAAVAKSGILLEASLAKAEPQPGDAKAGLLSLRNALARFLGETPAPVPRDGAPPPLKGLPLRAPLADLPPLPDVPRDAARALHSQADAAVSRTKLMQLASLPDPDPARPSTPAFRVELPFLIGHELVMAQMQISRDGARREAERRQRGWTMRFALNFSATGEVGAEVGLLGKAVNVSLWAVEPETAEALNKALPDLAMALEALGLSPGAMRIKSGPPEPERPRSGRLLDSVT